MTYLLDTNILFIMGKNDLWIAATAHVTNAKLLTSDHDFDHLNGVYVDVAKVLIRKQAL